MKEHQLLKQAYLDPARPGSFGGVDALYRAVKGRAKKKDIEEWLRGEKTYTLHKPVRRHFRRNRVIVGGIDEQWQADLVDLTSLKEHNNGNRYLLTCIDIFSKYAWAVPLNQKTSGSIVKAFKKIFKERKPLNLQTDQGSEFKNQKFQKFLKLQGVYFFTTKNETKASVVERFNRTLKTKMWKYFTSRNTNKYIDVLQKLIRSYNTSYHRSIKMEPYKVNLDNQKEVWKNLYSDVTQPQPQYVFGIGDTVRISKEKLHFEKGYETNWSEELFTISSLIPRTPPVYKIKDLLGEVVDGTFYKEELQKVKKSDSYPIERVLKKRKRLGKYEYYVKFRGYSDKFNSWILSSDLTTL